MTDKPKSTSWIITALVELEEKVHFYEPVDYDTACKKYMEDDVADITDWDRLGVDDVISAKPY